MTNSHLHATSTSVSTLELPFGELMPQNQKAEDSTAMDNSQQPPPAQAQPEPLMRCCQKTNIRDCDCLVPQGPCEIPEVAITHYGYQCICYSCQWVREVASDDTALNLTYGGKKGDGVYNGDISECCTDLEHIYPILVRERPQRWGWAFQAGKLWQLPYLASHSQCPESVERVTVGSDGKWKAILSDGTSFPLVHDMPYLNEIYPDYGYHPRCSPYEYELAGDYPRHPQNVNPAGYVSQRPPNQPRQFATMGHNTTLFIGGINKTVSDEELRSLFGNFGQIRYMNRSFQSTAFVQFEKRRDALMAMRQLQGVPVYSCRFRIAWGNPRMKNQDQFKVKPGPVPYKGYKHCYPRQPEQQKQEMHQSQGFNNIPRSENYQQQYQMPQMAYIPSEKVVWRYVPGHQHLPQQQMGYGCQDMAPQPPPSPPPSPENTHTRRPFKLNPCADWFHGNPKGKGPVIVSSDMVPNPCQESTHQPTQENIPSSPESHHTDRSTGESESSGDTGRTSPEKETSPKRETGPGSEDCERMDLIN